MTHLTVLYDADCALCRRARSWLESQTALVPLRFAAAASRSARQMFPGLDPASTLRQLTVIGDGGEVYRGAKAWLVCLWALRDYRHLSHDLSTPMALPIARRLIAWTSDHRHQVGRLLR